jgi:hypothetical protein
MDSCKNITSGNYLEVPTYLARHSKPPFFWWLKVEPRPQVHWESAPPLSYTQWKPLLICFGHLAIFFLSILFPFSEFSNSHPRRSLEDLFYWGLNLGSVYHWPISELQNWFILWRLFLKKHSRRQRSGGSGFDASSRQIVCETLSWKYPIQKRAGRVAGVVECLPTKHKALNSSSSITKNKTKQKTQQILTM